MTIDPTPMIALGIAVFGIYYMVIAIVLYLVIPRSQYEFSALNDFIDSCIAAISLIPATWLFLKTFNLI